MFEDMKYQSIYARKDIKVDDNSSLKRWKKKEVFDSRELLNQDSLIECSTSYSFNQGIVSFKANTSCFTQSPRPTYKFILKFNNLDISKFNRLHIQMNIESIGHRNFYIHVGFIANGNYLEEAPCIESNKWEDILYELNKIEDTIDVHFIQTIYITCHMMGTPDEANDDILINIRSVKLEKIELDDDLGWKLNNRIAYSHIGYLKESRKEAIVDIKQNSNFSIVDDKGNIIYQGTSKDVNNNLGSFKVLDFSNVQKEGLYKIVLKDIESNYFLISDEIYTSPILKSLNFLRSLRCGVSIDGVHSECHINCRCVHIDGRTCQISGGWHDAGDVSQFEICTAEITESLVDMANQYQDDYMMLERIKEEVKVGADWLLKTRFKDGYRALACLYNVWRSSIELPNDESLYKTVSENGPFENLLAALALYKASKLFVDDDPIYADWLRRAAIEDFNFGLEGFKQGLYSKRWGPCITSQTGGLIVQIASLLYIDTFDTKYQDIVEYYADEVIKCQEQDNPNINGFFYEDTEHRYMLTYEHRGHEQNPITGLVEACLTFKDNKNCSKWLKAIDLYKDYIKNSMKYTYPYNLVPGHVYHIDKLNMDRFTVPASYGTKDEAHLKLIEQAKHGIKVDDKMYLRIFPVAIQRRGFHATLLSKIKAASSILKLENDPVLYQIIIDQMEWIFGKNPFASSTMYGEGYNYHPLYVAFSNQIVGALPVGIETYQFLDEPYWPQKTQAVYKEIWGHTTGKLLYVLADLMEYKRYLK